MKGNIIGFDADTNTGAISGHDGRRYDFATVEWRGHGIPRHGDVVDFTPDGERATQIFLLEAEYAQPSFGQFYFSPSGRISRSQFWLRGMLPIYGIMIVLYVIMIIGISAKSGVITGIFSVIVSIYALIVIWPIIAVWVKRIHDRNKSGWYLLIPIIAGIIVAIVMIVAIASTVSAIMTGHDSEVGLLAGAGVFAVILYLINFGIGIWFFVEFGCMRGTIGANLYGPDPVPHR